MLAAAGLPAPAGLPPRFEGLTADSRAVGPGMLYAALPGVRADGRDFIGEAVARGAAAVLAPLGTAWPAGVPLRPLILDAEPRRALARLAAAFAGPQPGTVVAVTGTNGKTSVAEFMRQMFVLSGRRAASLGTLGVVGPDGVGTPKFATPGLTTPDPVALAEILAGLARDGVEDVAIEASSHGLDQYRLDGVRLAAGGFTNLTRDHLDYHGDMAGYRAAKLRLFAELLPEGAPVVASAGLEAETLEALRGIAVRRRLKLQVVGAEARAVAGGQVLRVGGREVVLRLPGRFQAENAVLAAALAEAAGVVDALALLPLLVGVRGRLELAAEVDGWAAYVDFAHTPDALERLLTALRAHTSGRLVLVFGAGGDRDAGKRPLMGAVAARLADVVIVTDDNPRGEVPGAIRAAIACEGGIEIGDRERAIATALGMLRAGDVLAVAGKGHESGQTVGGVTTAFDDVAVVRRLVGAGGAAAAGTRTPALSAALSKRGREI